MGDRTKTERLYRTIIFTGMVGYAFDKALVCSERISGEWFSWVSMDSADLWSFMIAWTLSTVGGYLVLAVGSAVAIAAGRAISDARSE